MPSSETINTSTDALITLSSSWGIGITLLFVIILASVALIGIYLWRVLPIKVKRESEIQKQEMVKESEIYKQDVMKEIQGIREHLIIRQPTEDDTIKLELSNQINNRFKAIWAELSKIEKRLQGIEVSCPQHKTTMGEVLVKLQAINEALPQLAASIESINSKVWDIAMKKGGGL